MPRNERFCKICNLNVIEDEFHFLFSCPPYQLERSDYYVNCVPEIGDFMLKEDASKLAWILSEDNIRNTAKYVERIYDKRRSILYKPN